MATSFYYLENNLNSVVMILRKPNLTKEDLIHAAAIVCYTFDQLIKDDQFVGIVNQFFDNDAELSDEYQTALRMFDDFLEEERDILLRGGLSPEVVEFIIGKLDNLQEQIQSKRLTTETIISDLSKLHVQVCAFADQLTAELEQEEAEEQRLSTLRKNRRKIRKYVGGLGGAAVIVLDAAIPPPISLLSGAAGGALLGDAILPGTDD